ncbi:MAG: glycoside hydrolase family 3 protein [Firmicutes bacterium]|nr:glycoside hydrolase family 3 protein [Bacillota bacterium]
MVDLTKKPFYLNKEQIDWVEETIANMTEDEKVGQLFTIMNIRKDDEEHIKAQIEKYHPGGLRWQGGNKEENWNQNRLFQKHSKIPMVIAANIETGASKSIGGGTLIAPGPAVGAGRGDKVARLLAKAGGEEAKAIGCNWTFAPISDVVSNWRNTIVNNRAFSDDPDNVIRNCKAYMEEMKKLGIACCTKHFPGDGSEERDQHLVLGCNDLSVEEWEESFGKVYRELIDAGVESFMIGHICQPALQKKYNPSLKDEDIMPATLSKELLQDVLRGELGFNGLIITDASHMGGMACMAPRSHQVPGAIAAGCDMYLYYNDGEEDFEYMREGIRSGLITEERLSDALHRILGFKAMLGLNELVFPDKEGLSVVGSEEHHNMAYEAADESVTLVKDTQHILPVNPEERKRVRLYYVESAPVSSVAGTDQAKYVVKEELEKLGFEVDLHKNFYEVEKENPGKTNLWSILEATEKMEEFKKKYDLVLLVINMVGYAQENNVRIKWDIAHSNEIPWYIHEVPTVGISLNYTNHLYDVPQLKTFINAYSSEREYIRAALEKMAGKSEFTGTANELVWCGRWETRL